MVRDSLTGIPGVCVGLCSIAFSLIFGELCAAEQSPSDPHSLATGSDARGTVEGTVFYQSDTKRPWRYARYYVKDRKQGELAEAVVALKSRTLKNNVPHRDPVTTVIDQMNFQFVPETVAIQTGDRVRFLNSDEVTHNVQSVHPSHSFNVNLSAGKQHQETFRHASGLWRPFRVGCIYHSAMRAWVFVFDHPYFHVTEADGRFRLNNIPAGEYKLEMIHPAGQLRWQQTIQVEADETTTTEIRLSPDDMAKQRSQ